MSLTKPTNEDLLDVLRRAYKHLVEHNKEYHHVTPNKFLEEVRELIDDDKQEKTNNSD